MIKREICEYIVKHRTCDGIKCLEHDCPVDCCGDYSNIVGYAKLWLKNNLTPAQENAYKGSPRDSKPNKVYGVVGDTKDAVQPVFHIGDKIRYKSTGTIEKVHYITGGRFINGVDVNDVEKL